MIPYDLILTASHRPHLLEPTLTSLLENVDQPPARLLIHDDAVPTFQPKVPTRSDDLPGSAEQVAEARAQTQEILVKLNPPMPVIYRWADPPRKLGMALRFLLDNVQTEYVLYSQDDHVVIRPVPIKDALAVLKVFDFHQIRFNKRATLAHKDTWRGPWRKQEIFAQIGLEAVEAGLAERLFDQALCISDHWYFQLGLWRVAPIQAAVAWMTETPQRRALLERGQVIAEEAINHAMDGHFGPIPGLTLPRPDEDASDPTVRWNTQRTFIWGPVGENRFARHVGGGDPSGSHARDGGVDDPKRAWREIEEERRRYGG